MPINSNEKATNPPPSPRRESVGDGLAPLTSSPIVSVVKNEIHTPASAEDGLAPPASSPIISVVKNEIYPSANQSSAAEKTKRLTRKDGYPDSIITDPNGSYTGTPLNPTEQPIQDVDDL